MARVFICTECDGRGLHTFDRGPAVERCTGCDGVGLRFSSIATAGRDFSDALTSPRGSELVSLSEADTIRALSWLVARAEERCEALERELARRV
jgi:hypothetical protein